MVRKDPTKRGYRAAGWLHILRCNENGATGRYALQRLFSTFPGGKPGIGLLLLRAAVGVTVIAAGVVYLSAASGSFLCMVLGLALTTGGAALVIGFLTPLAAVLVGLGFLGIAFSWFPAPDWGLHDTRAIAVGMIVTTIAIGLLGPGTFSLDGRLFGRREIVIPPSSRPPES